LGWSQGFCSASDNQYVQQLIPNSQGFAVGIYETVSYISLAIFGLVTATIVAGTKRNRPEPQQLALGLTALGLLVAFFLIPKHDPRAEAMLDARHKRPVGPPVSGALTKPQWRVFIEVSFLQRVPSMSCFAGIMIQVAVGLAWTLLPLYFRSTGLTDKVVLASITTTFNAIRGVIQMFSGTLSDLFGGRPVVVFGFGLCSLSFILSAAIPDTHPGMDVSSLISLWVGCAALLGIGVGTVYPVLAAEVGKSVLSRDRDIAISTFRFWRELGYAFGGGISITILTRESVATCVIIIGILLGVTALILAIGYGPAKPLKESGKILKDTETEAETELPAKTPQEAGTATV